MNSKEKDIELWEAFRNGNKEAYGALFRTYYPLLFQFGNKFTPDIKLVEDCIQELFVQLWLSQSQTPVLSVKAYLIKSLKYTLLKALRKNDRIQLDDLLSETGFELSYEHFVIAREQNEENISKIKSALQQLSNRQKEIIYLKFYHNLSYEEIIDIMNINYQVARNLLYQSIKTLKKILG